MRTDYFCKYRQIGNTSSMLDCRVDCRVDRKKGKVGGCTCACIRVQDKGPQQKLPYRANKAVIYDELTL